MFTFFGAKMRKALGLDDPERDARDQARAAARLQAQEAKKEAAASRIKREWAVASTQYARRVRGSGR